MWLQQMLLRRKGRLSEIAYALRSTNAIWRTVCSKTVISAQQAFEGHRIRWEEAKVLQFEPNATYMKCMEWAQMSLVAQPNGQPLSVLSELPSLKRKSENYNSAQFRSYGKLQFLCWYYRGPHLSNGFALCSTLYGILKFRLLEFIPWYLLHIHLSLKCEFKCRETVATGGTPHECVRFQIFILTTADGLCWVCIIYPALC
jgi:hypothetical protein